MITFEIVHTSKDCVLISDETIVKQWDFKGIEIERIPLERFNDFILTQKLIKLY